MRWDGRHEPKPATKNVITVSPTRTQSAISTSLEQRAKRGPQVASSHAHRAGSGILWRARRSPQPRPLARANALIEPNTR
jgi:hypothetical protein